MKHARGRLLVACLVVAASAVAVAGGSAGNRVGTPTLEAVPGPGAVSYGENIAYTASFSNDGNSTFTHTTFKMAPPVIQATGETATFVKASCGAVDSAGVLACDFGNLNARAVARLTVVWNVPAGDSKPGLHRAPTASSPTSTWQINENKSTNGNETFQQSAGADLIGTSPQDPVSNQLRAGGYEITSCAAGGSSLSTNQAVSKSNPVATSFCLPELRDRRDRPRARDDDHRDSGQRPHVGGVRGGPRSELPGRLPRGLRHLGRGHHVHVPRLG